MQLLARSSMMPIVSPFCWWARQSSCIPAGSCLFPKLLLPFSSGVALNSPSRLFFFCGLRLFPMCWKLRFLEQLEERWNHQTIKNDILALSPKISEVFTGRCLCWITFFLSCFPDSSLLSYQYSFIQSHAISIKIFRPKDSVILYFVFLNFKNRNYCIIRNYRLKYQAISPLSRLC